MGIVLPSTVKSTNKIVTKFTLFDRFLNPYILPLYRFGSRIEEPSHGARWASHYQPRLMETSWHPTLAFWTRYPRIGTTQRWKHRELLRLPWWTVLITKWWPLQTRRVALWKATRTTQSFHACLEEPRRSRSKRITWASWFHAVTRNSIRKDTASSRRQAMPNLQWSNSWWSMTTSPRTRPSGPRWRLLFLLSRPRITSWCLPPNTSPARSRTCRSGSSQRILGPSLPSEQVKP